MPLKCNAEKFAIKSSDGKRTYLEMPHAILEATGLAMPPLEHRTVQSPFQHGASYLGFSLQPRVVQFAIHGRGCTRMEMWELRQEFINLLNPLVGTLRIRAEFPDGNVYELHDVVYDSQFDVGTDGQPEPRVQQFGIRMIAYDPVWYSWPQRSAPETLVLEESLIFGNTSPATSRFPIVFDATTLRQEFDITVRGNWNAFPDIILSGPMADPLVENLTTGEKLELDYFIGPTEIVTISTRFGQKSVTNDDGDNLIGYLTTDSDLSTFHLSPDPIVEDGVNEMRIYSESVGDNTDLEIRWFDRLLGI